MYQNLAKGGNKNCDLSAVISFALVKYLNLKTLLLVVCRFLEDIVENMRLVIFVCAL